MVGYSSLGLGNTGDQQNTLVKINLTVKAGWGVWRGEIFRKKTS